MLGFGVGVWDVAIRVGKVATPFDGLPVLGRYSAFSFVEDDGSGVGSWSPEQGSGSWLATTDRASHDTSGVPFVEFGGGGDNRRLVGDDVIKDWGTLLGDGFSVAGLVWFDATTGNTSLVQLGRSSPNFERMDVVYQPVNRTLASTNRVTPGGTANYISNNNSLPAAAGAHTFAMSYDGTLARERYWVDGVSKIDQASGVSGAYTQAAMTNAFLGCGEFDGTCSPFRVYEMVFINGPLSDAEVTLIHEYLTGRYPGVVA